MENKEEEMEKNKNKKEKEKNEKEKKNRKEKNKKEKEKNVKKNKRIETHRMAGMVGAPSATRLDEKEKGDSGGGVYNIY